MYRYDTPLFKYPIGKSNKHPIGTARVMQWKITALAALVKEISARFKQTKLDI